MTQVGSVHDLLVQLVSCQLHASHHPHLAVESLAAPVCLSPPSGLWRINLQLGAHAHELYAASVPGIVLSLRSEGPCSAQLRSLASRSAVGDTAVLNAYAVGAEWARLHCDGVGAALLCKACGIVHWPSQTSGVRGQTLRLSES